MHAAFVDLVHRLNSLHCGFSLRTHVGAFAKRAEARPAQEFCLRELQARATELVKEPQGLLVLSGTHALARVRTLPPYT